MIFPRSEGNSEFADAMESLPEYKTQLAAHKHLLSVRLSPAGYLKRN
jgi:hypothetical protein